MKKRFLAIILCLAMCFTMLPMSVFAADATYTVTLAVNRTDLGSVSGDGEYANGAAVTLTATAKYDNVFFAYWLDNSVTLSEEPAAAELAAAIVSYDSTYTFTAAQDISLTAVFAYNTSISVNGMYYANEDEIFSGEESGTNIEEIQTTTEIGKQSVTISASDYDEFVTIDHVVYERNCMFTWTYDQTTEQIVYTTHDSLSIPVAPVYNSVEYWAYLAEYEAPVTVAYVPHTHSYSAVDYNGDNHWDVCSCGDKKDEAAHEWTYTYDDDKMHTMACTVCEYEAGGSHFGIINTMVDDDYHWWNLPCCGNEKNKGSHTYDNAYATQCNATFGIERCTYDRSQSCTHSWGNYSNKNDVHEKTCSKCGLTVSENHFANTYNAIAENDTINAAAHTEVCACGKSWEAAHELIQTNPNVHTTKCTLCIFSSDNHVYTVFKPSEANPETYHVAYCFMCDEMSDPVQVAGHNYGGRGYGPAEHWDQCTDCGHTTGKTAHQMTVAPNDGDDATHIVYCDGCEYAKYENCVFDAYDGDEDYHWTVCSACGDTPSRIGMQAHVDGNSDGKCDVCGVSFGQSTPTGGSSDDDDYTPPIATDTEQNENGDTVTTAEPISIVRNDRATTAITIADGNRLVNEVVRNGSDQLVIAPKIVGNVSSAEISIPSSVMERFVERANADLQLVTPIADASLDPDTLARYMGELSMETRRTDDTIAATVTIGSVTVIDAGVELPEGIEMTDDMKLIVSTEKATLAPIASTIVPTAETEYVDIPENNISRLEDKAYAYMNAGYMLGEIVVIDGEKYMVSDGVGVLAHLIRLSDKAVFTSDGSTLAPSSTPYDVEIQTNRTIVINGAKYDVPATIDHNDIEQFVVLYVDGVQAGLYIPSNNEASFYEGYDPETLKAQQDDNDLGTVTIPADYNNAAIADFAPGKTYKVSVIGANDISVEGYDDALLNSITEDTPEIAATKAELERLKADMDAKWWALTQMDINDPNYTDTEITYNETSQAYASAYASLADLTNLQGATVSQTFKIPDALVGAKNVKYVGVHDTNPYAAELAEAERVMNSYEPGSPDYSQAMNDYTIVKYRYDAWEKENGSGAEFGTVTLSLDGLTLTATHTAVKGFSPFIVYAFVEADEPEYQVIGSPFADVSAGAWYYDAVKYAYENGLMAGTSTAERLFSPDGITTRAQIVTILHRLEGAPVVDYLMRFSDVAEEQWHTEAIRWAASTGITSGTGDGTTFSPNDPITREQFAAFLYRYAQHKGIDVSVGEDTNILSFEDALTVSEYAIPAMQWACGAGIIGGKPGNLLDPQGGATRAEAATMLMRFNNK